MATPDMGNLDLSDTESDLFASPSRIASKAAANGGLKSEQHATSAARIGESRYDAEQAREDALRKELESVRSINEVIEGVVSSLKRAKGNMDNVSRTVTSASTLLDTWSRILSQTEHNQRLILNPNWQGATNDIAEMENEAVLKVQAEQRKAAEEERRREEAKRRAEDEERQRQAGTATRGARGTRARATGVGRGSVTSSGYGRPPSGLGRGTSSTSSSRAGSGIGRGVASTRGRARGVR